MFEKYQIFISELLYQINPNNSSDTNWFNSEKILKSRFLIKKIVNNVYCGPLKSNYSEDIMQEIGIENNNLYKFEAPVFLNYCGLLYYANFSSHKSGKKLITISKYPYQISELKKINKCDIDNKERFYNFSEDPSYIEYFFKNKFNNSLIDYRDLTLFCIIFNIDINQDITEILKYIVAYAVYDKILCNWHSKFLNYFSIIKNAKTISIREKPKNCTCNYDSLLSFLVNKSREDIKDYVEKIEGVKIIDITDKNFNSNCKINLHIKNKNHLKFNMLVKLFEYNFNIDNSEIFKYLLNNETDVIKIIEDIFNFRLVEHYHLIIEDSFSPYNSINFNTNNICIIQK